MCTLIVLDGLVPGFPLILASNRDEYLSRPAAPPVRMGVEAAGRASFVAPQDLEGGGTWMGVNSHGLVVALTNRPTEARREDRRSRGLLVMDSLARATPREVAEDMREGLEATYNPFNLFYSDGRESFVTSLREDGASTSALAPGVHVLCNRDIDDPGSPKIAGIQTRLGDLDMTGSLERIVAGLSDVLRAHGDPANPMDHVCVHTPTYGTRSSAVLALGRSRWRYWHAEGPPCETKYRNYTTLLDDLRQHPQSPR